MFEHQKRSKSVASNNNLALNIQTSQCARNRITGRLMRGNRSVTQKYQCTDLAN